MITNILFRDTCPEEMITQLSRDVKIFSKFFGQVKMFGYVSYNEPNSSIKGELCKVHFLVDRLFSYFTAFTVLHYK